MFRGPQLGSTCYAGWIECAWSTWSPSTTGEGGRETGKGQIRKGIASLVKGFLNSKNWRVVEEGSKERKLKKSYSLLRSFQRFKRLTWATASGQSDLLDDMFVSFAKTIFFLTPRVESPKKLNIRSIFISVLLPQLTRGISSIISELWMLL